MEKSEKICILGPSGSGKDFLRRELIKLGLKYTPKFTTRPKRKLEVDGVDYNFIDLDTFNKINQEGKVKSYQSFLINGDVWYYGITKENWISNQLFIMTPEELCQLSKTELKGCFVVYLNIDIETRRARIAKRNDSNDSIERRLKSDESDFKDFNYYDLGITDPEFDAVWIYDLMS